MDYSDFQPDFISDAGFVSFLSPLSPTSIVFLWMHLKLYISDSQSVNLIYVH